MSKTNVVPLKWMFEQFEKTTMSDGVERDIYEHQPITIHYDCDSDALVIGRKAVISIDNIQEFKNVLDKIVIQVREEER
jgi:hypothetical protein